MSIELGLEEKPGIKKISVDYPSEKAEIDFDENKISEKEVVREITKLGYKVK